MKKLKRPKERQLNASVDVACPFCGQVESITIDEGGGEKQTLIEDCSVCCKPRIVHFDSSPDVTEGARVWLERDDGL